MKKRQMSVRWPGPLYMLAEKVGKKEKRSTGWVLTDWAEKGAKADGYAVPDSSTISEIEKNNQ